MVRLMLTLLCSYGNGKKTDKSEGYYLIYSVELLLLLMFLVVKDNNKKIIIINNLYDIILYFFYVGRMQICMKCLCRYMVPF